MNSFKRGVIFALILLMLPFAGRAQQAPDALSEAQEAHVLGALEAIVKYASDGTSQINLTKYFDKKSEAWKPISLLDSGYFSSTNWREFSNERTDGWEWLDDTHFSVNAYCDYTLSFDRGVTTVNYPCAYNFTFALMPNTTDVWKVVEFKNLPIGEDARLASELSEADDGIEVRTVLGDSFIGYMLIIDDASRVFAGTIDYFGDNQRGLHIDDLCAKYEAVGGINGGGFTGTSDGKKGGNPFGIVVSNGVMLRKHTPGAKHYKTIIGFDTDNKLVVANCGMKEVEQLNLRDALAFNPPLVLNGEAVDNGTYRNNYSSRTAIGQDADGRVLMLIVKGRQPNSLGASMSQLSRVFVEFGAVTAGNLDGGSSISMYLYGTALASGYQTSISRRIPTAFLIKPLE